MIFLFLKRNLRTIYDSIVLCLKKSQNGQLNFDHKRSNNNKQTMNKSITTIVLILVAVTIVVHSWENFQCTPGTKFFAALTGHNELNPVTLAAGNGDPDGSGIAELVINMDQDNNQSGTAQICFNIKVAEISSPTEAHIHAGNRFENGPIVVPLFGTDTITVFPDASCGFSGCVQESFEVLFNITSRPIDFYVNVHNIDFPQGAIRGQVEPN